MGVVIANGANGNGSQATYRKLHLVLHGLIAVRVSESDKAVILHIPTVEMHKYMAGTFASLQPLEKGFDYRLNNISPGKLKLDPERIVDDFVSLPLESKNLQLKPRDTHASIQLPWPSDLKCVRLLEQGDDPLFNEGVNPRELGYISYFTYMLKPGDRPVLRRNGSIFWSSEGQDEHTRLHFFADPGQTLTPDIYPKHMHDAYTAFNDQLFAKPFDLMPNVDTRMKFNPSANSPDIPDNEAVDLANVGQFQPHVEATGNCLSVVLLD